MHQISDQWTYWFPFRCVFTLLQNITFLFVAKSIVTHEISFSVSNTQHFLTSLVLPCSVWIWVQLPHAMGIIHTHILLPEPNAYRQKYIINLNVFYFSKTKKWKSQKLFLYIFHRRHGERGNKFIDFFFYLAIFCHVHHDLGVYSHALKPIYVAYLKWYLSWKL